MKKRIAVIMALIMICSLGVINIQADSWKAFITPIDAVNNKEYKNGETVPLAVGERLFLFFNTDFSGNPAHGISPVTGFSDGFPGGSLSSKGFSVRTGEAKALGYKGDLFGIEIGTGKLKPGATGELGYFLYKHPNNQTDDGGFDFITTPHKLDQKIYIQVVPKIMKISSLKAGKKSLTVKWKKQSDISGYQIRYSTKKDFSSGVKTKTVKSAKKTSLKLTKLKAKKKYYVQIRSYKTVKGKKVCSAWSGTKSKKTK